SDGILLLMPAVAEGFRSYMGVKLISYFPNNHARSMEIIQGIYVLQDAETGHTLSIIEAGSLTAIRTPAASAVATRWMDRQDSSVLGIFGTGVEAVGHVRAMRAVLPIREVLVCGTSRSKSEDFAARLSKTERVSARAATPDEMAASAHVICTC